MNLYYVWQEEAVGYDTYDSMVVVAENIVEARSMNPNYGSGGWQDDFSCSGAWAPSPADVSARLIGTANDDLEKGIILSSFNAG